MGELCTHGNWHEWMSESAEVKRLSPGRLRPAMLREAVPPRKGLDQTQEASCIYP